jgi:glycerophosphoryl diester phosphodiesterase
MSSPLWFSHRGYHEKHSENSLEAFRAAVSMGFEGLETDLRISSDGHLVLCHDKSLDRLGIPGCVVNQLSRSKLEKIQLKNGERLLFWDNFCEEFSSQSWILDIKPDHGFEVLSALSQFSKRNSMKFLDRSRFLFWTEDQERACQRYFPAARYCARKTQCFAAAFSTILRAPSKFTVSPSKVYALPANLYGLNLYRKPIVDRYKALGAHVIAYLPKTDEQTFFALSSGCDQILTNGKIIQNK